MIDAHQRLKELWGLTDDDVDALKPCFEVCNFTKGSFIFTEGEAHPFVYLILEGSASVTKSIAAQEVPLLKLGVGSIAGEASMFNKDPLESSLIAATSTTALRLDASMFQKIITSNASVSNAIFKSLSKELTTFRSILGSTLGSKRSYDHRVAFFDFKPHERVSVERVASLFREKYNAETKYLPVKLSVETVPLAAGCEVISIFVNDCADAEVLAKLSALGVKMIALRCAGFNNVDLKAAKELGFQLARVPAYSPFAVAEHATALILALNRKIVHAYSRVKQGNFSLNNLVGFDLHGKTVGVIGTGKIGQCFVKIMLGFGCKVLCHDVYRSKELEALENCRYVDTLDELYGESRIISLHVPLFPETKYLINKDSIAKMQKGVMIINTSRGPLINTRDLISGLKSGQVGFAGLDVYEEEGAYFFEDMSASIMTDDVLARLMTFNNVIITSHQAFLTDEALTAIAETSFANIEEFLASKPLSNAVPL